jgi:hypothetical protein
MGIRYERKAKTNLKQMEMDRSIGRIINIKTSNFPADIPPF